MVMTRRKRAVAEPLALTDPQPQTHIPSNNNNDITEESAENAKVSVSDSVSEYEQIRKRRIQENLQRMQKLGILGLASNLKSELLPPLIKRPKPKSPNSNPIFSQNPNPLLPYESARRSSRLKSVGPVSYAESRDPAPKKPKSVKICIPKGAELEVYTEEHERLLGDCNTSWILAVDGYGEDGKRIYDPVKGKSCHQCRQKTLGHHTECSRCNSGYGQFCGDCLYMRYGENVMEANQNPNWICPGCRGFCNCSLCRQAKGWMPTGNLYRKVLALGFKSVAHYLVITRCPRTNSEGTGEGNMLSSESSMRTEDCGLSGAEPDRIKDVEM